MDNTTSIDGSKLPYYLDNPYDILMYSIGSFFLPIFNRYNITPNILTIVVCLQRYLGIGTKNLFIIVFLIYLAITIKR